MGITSFFPWLRNNFGQYITKYRSNARISPYDNVHIDMNGLIHNSAQRIYGYGQYENTVSPESLSRISNKDVYEAVCNDIDKMVHILNPRLRLVLCVDGVAPLAKQVQQRQRRYKSQASAVFNTAMISPGTSFMKELDEYINSFLARRKYTIEVVYSSHECAGEGEAKIMNYIRYYGIEGTNLIYGSDADIILLALCSPAQTVDVIRDDMNGGFSLISASRIREQLGEQLVWKKNAEKYSHRQAVLDFVFMCFFVGNDFLKRAPGVDILIGGIEKLIDVYKTTSRHIVGSDMYIDIDSLGVFMSGIAKLEKDLFVKKMLVRNTYFRDELFESSIEGDVFDLELYKQKYYSKYFNQDNDFSGEVSDSSRKVSDVCMDYIEGFRWIMSYYVDGVPSWNWHYPHFKSPFLSDIAYTIHRNKRECKLRIMKNYGRTVPNNPLLQLVIILPPSSMYLLLAPYNTLYIDKRISKFFPEKFEIDLSGKKHEYESEIVLPEIDFDLVKNVFDELENKIGNREQINKFSSSYSLINKQKYFIDL